jgi:hypothetical protein
MISEFEACDSPERSPAKSSDTKLAGSGIERQWHDRLCSLEQWICELLIKNEQLRISLHMAEAARRKNEQEPAVECA